jgi:hypothetical protein
MIGNDIVEGVKNAAVFLTSLSGATYACGYLVVRSRARALGIDPGFALVDQAYVFAGFRFVLVLLVSLLVSIPLLQLLRWLGSRALGLTAGQLCVLETSGVVVAGAATIWLYLLTTRVSGVLLGGTSDWAAEAVVGRNSYGVWLVLGTTMSAAALFLWDRAHILRVGNLDLLGAALTLIFVLLIVILPVQHGVFHADRTARRLDRAPEGAGSLSPPVWVIDRTADRVTLLGHGKDGQTRLMAVKADQLDGVPVVGIGSLNEALGGAKP